MACGNTTYHYLNMQKLSFKCSLTKRVEKEIICPDIVQSLTGHFFQPPVSSMHAYFNTRIYILLPGPCPKGQKLLQINVHSMLMLRQGENGRREKREKERKRERDILQ